MMKYFVISDVHSKYDLMIKALEDNGYDINNDNHKIIFLGDAFDKGDNPVGVYVFFKELIKANKMIWILGNHDVELIDCIKDSNRKTKDTAIKIAHFYNKKINKDTPVSEINKCIIDNGVLDLLENKTCNYFETDHYLFTHGCIPSKGNKIVANFRDLTYNQWKGRTINGVKKVLVDGLVIPDKVLVCGHVGSYYGHLITKYPFVDVKSKEFENIKKDFIKNKENYKSFISSKVINIDANGYKNGFINVLVIDE